MNLKTIWTGSRLFEKITEKQNIRFRNRLNNHNFTILCPNCIGGAIYNRLGERFNSPTINIFMLPKDFCAFLQYIHFYLSSTFSEANEIDGVPTGILHGNDNNIPDITVRFVHYKTFEEGVRKWNERKKRIIWENLYLIGFDIDPADRSEFKKTESLPCNNRVLLTADKNCSIRWSHYISPHKRKPNALYFLDRDIFGLRTFEKKFDFVDFLNQKNN